MAKNWGRTPVTNADKRAATMMKYLVDTTEGPEERIDRRPLGKVERFVDPDGGVMSLQVYADGDPRRHESEIRRRAELHKKGFVEYARCPIKHGTRYSCESTKKDFAKMPANLSAECKHDKKSMERRDGDLYAGTSCPHIEWLVDFRRKKAGDAYAKRNAAQVKADEARKTRVKLEEVQAAALTELLAERKPSAQRKPKEAGE